MTPEAKKFVALVTSHQSAHPKLTYDECWQICAALHADAHAAMVNPDESVRRAEMANEQSNRRAAKKRNKDRQDAINAERQRNPLLDYDTVYRNVMRAHPEFANTSRPAPVAAPFVATK